MNDHGHSSSECGQMFCRLVSIFVILSELGSLMVESLAEKLLDSPQWLFLLAISSLSTNSLSPTHFEYIIYEQQSEIPKDTDWR